MNIGFKWVLWIHCHKFLWYVTANNHVSCQLQLDHVTFILLHYSRVDIIYSWMKRERDALPYTMENVFYIYFESCIRQNLSFPNGVIKDVICIIWGFSWKCCTAENLLGDICESNISTENSGEEIRSNVYSLGIIRSFSGFPKWFLFLFPCVEVIPNWQVIKCSKRSDFFVFIAYNVLLSLQWQMNFRTYLVDDADLEDKNMSSIIQLILYWV